MELGLHGRRCIVTGASQGIGKAIAVELGREGAHVAMLARSADALEAAAHEVQALGVRAVPVVTDVSEPGSVERGIAVALEALGGIDVLVNNAGSSPTGSFDRITDEDWSHSFELKVLGYVRCIRAVLPAMRHQGGGRIVNVAGAGGRQARARYVLGCLNAAVLHLTKSLAEQLAPEGIGVVAINPGPTATERMEEGIRGWAVAAGQDPVAFRERFIAAELPLGRMATPEELARLVVVMCSDLAEQLTGSAVQADGAATTGVF